MSTTLALMTKSFEGVSFLNSLRIKIPTLNLEEHIEIIAVFFTWLLSLTVINLLFLNYSFTCIFSLDTIYRLGCSFLSFLSGFPVKKQIIYSLFHISS